MYKRCNLFESLIDDLKYLRKGAGVTPAKLRNAPTALALLGDPNEPYRNYLTRLQTAIESLPGNESAKLLMVAFGLLSECKDIPYLSARRDWYGEQIHLKREAVADREDAAIHELAIELASFYFSKSSPSAAIPCPHGTAIQEHVSIRVLVEDALWLRTDERYCLVMLSSGISHLEFTSAYPAVASSDSSVVLSVESSADGLRHRLVLGEVLQRGSLVDLSFSLSPRQARSNRETLRVASRAHHIPTISCEYQ
jgi:hypothetical protein